MKTDTIRPMRPVDVAAREQTPPQTGDVVFDIQNLQASYGSNVAIKGVDLDIYRNLITAVIGPSGCGKSTFIRCLNRMNDEVAGFRHEGNILYHGIDLYDDRVDPRLGGPRGGGGSPKAPPVPQKVFTTRWGGPGGGLQKGGGRGAGGRPPP